MKILSKYISSTVLKAIAMVVVLLIGLQIFVLFISQMDDIGKGDYGVWQALFYVILQTPYQLYLFFPMASLLGCLLGLGVLAQHSELVVTRAAGISVLQVSRTITITALWLIIIVALLAEFVVPKAVSYAEAEKAYQISGGQALQTAQGMWLRKDNMIIHINSVWSDGRLQGVTNYKFNNNLQLQEVEFAKSAENKSGKWILHDVASSTIGAEQISANQVAVKDWPISLNTSALLSARLEPSALSLRRLLAYLKLNYSDMQHGAHALAFWQRLLQPFAILVMMLLAIPFIFGPLRSATMGLRFLAGAAVGFGFYILNQVFGPISLVYQVPALLAAALPTVLFAIIAIFMLWRAK